MIFMTDDTLGDLLHQLPPHYTTINQYYYHMIFRRTTHLDDGGERGRRESAGRGETE